MGRGLHLTLEKRIKIEEYLNEGESFKSIAKYIKKDCTTLSKEIKNNYTTLLPSTFNNQYNNCDKKRICKHKNVCGNNCDKLCRTCSKCNEYCIYFEQETLCEKLLKPPYCCNSCNKRKGCRKEKHIYKAKEADNKYREKLTNSREDINLTKDELDNLFKIVKKA